MSIIYLFKAEYDDKVVGKRDDNVEEIWKVNAR